MEFKIDPEFKSLVPPLTYEELSQLEENILKDGIRDPLVFWGGPPVSEYEVLVDGHNRYEIAKKHGLQFKTKELEILNRDDVKVWIINNQFGRRNINNYQRFVLALKLEDIYKAKAKKTQGTRTDLTSSRNLQKVDTRSELAKTAKVSHDTISKVKKIEEKASPEIKAKLNNGDIHINKAFNEIKKQERREEKIKAFQEKSLQFDNKDIKIEYIDFRKYAENVNDNSIDLILTDPPYPGEHLNLWGDLFKIANRILKPSSFLICYSGQMYLDKIFRMDNELIYYWTANIIFTKKPMIMGRNIINEWKPILIFQKTPFKKISDTISDTISFDYTERDMHDKNWGQTIAPFEFLVEIFSNPGDLIFEPFAGTGTTLIAAKNMKRRCIGTEIEEEYIDLIKGRLV